MKKDKENSEKTVAEMIGGKILLIFSISANLVQKNNVCQIYRFLFFDEIKQKEYSILHK